MNTLFVGIDVSTKNNQVCAVDFDQDVFFNLSFPNSPAGCDSLMTTVLAFVDKEKFDSIIIVTESTSIYDYHVCAYLSSQLAIVGRCRNLRPFKVAQHIALKRLTRERYHLAEQLVREKNYVLNNIYLKVSGLMTLPISNQHLKTDAMTMVKLLLFLTGQSVLPIDLIRLHMTLLPFLLLPLST